GGRARARYTSVAARVVLGASYRDVAVLTRRPIDFLVARLLDAPDDHAPRFGGVDHVVDHRPAGREVRVDLRPDRLDQLAARLLRGGGRFDLRVEDDVDAGPPCHSP